MGDDRGRVVSHPAILELTSKTVGSTRAQKVRLHGLGVAVYAAKRLIFKQPVIDRMAEDEALLVRVRNDNVSFDLAILKSELMEAFPTIFQSKSWKTRGSHDFSGIPPAARPFLLNEHRGEPPETPTPTKSRGEGHGFGSA